MDRKQSWILNIHGSQVQVSNDRKEFGIASIPGLHAYRASSVTRLSWWSYEGPGADTRMNETRRKDIHVEL